MSIGRNWRWLTVSAWIIIGAAGIRAQEQTPAVKAPAVDFVTAAELKAKVVNNEPVTIIDVRGSESYAASTTTIKGAMHFKLRRLKSRLTFAPLKDVSRDREIVTYCSCPQDESSIAAAQILKSSGFKRVRVLQGGWQQWLRISGPVEPRPRG